ncbi:MAG TPA: indole-3-glycerol-phosphate synthase TrpC, partial [candidate division Zixibacteria bacterium]|nr:indole-3-glycerol-phosphate synthase TrpC [candidate division Zixibacteria bacterium]
EAELDVLVETHTAGEIDRALEAGCDIIGVNNRDLDTFEVSLDTALDLALRLPANVIKVAESGIETHADVAALTAVGYSTFLVGEALMRASDRATALSTLRGERR